MGALSGLSLRRSTGEVPERLNGHDWKSCDGGQPRPRVRIPPSPLAARDAARLASPSQSRRSAVASPAPTARGRPVTCAGTTTRLASIASSRILNSRATTDASTSSPSESCPPPSGTAARVLDGGVGPVARAVLLESLRRPLGHRDDLCIAFTPRLGSQDIAGSEHRQGGEPHRSLLVTSMRRRTAEMAALAAVAATTAVTPDLTALGGWTSDSADPTPDGSCASRAALTARSNRVLRRNGLMSSSPLGRRRSGAQRVVRD